MNNKNTILLLIILAIISTNVYSQITSLSDWKIIEDNTSLGLAAFSINKFQFIDIMQSGSSKSLINYSLCQSQDAYVIDLNGLESGNYILVLMVDGQSIASSKFNIIK